ncbi:MAG TPA: DUF1552 domain-containing protein [Polyangiaceae bacterium]|nr:DUF1552 domain-containing protein [Polyangiaceae bacterium]
MNELLNHSAGRSSARPIRRRRFLRGIAGAVLGLPFLESLTPRLARGQADAPVKRLAVFFCCNGVNVPRWFPKLVSGPLLDEHLLGTANEPLLPFRDKLLFPRGIHMAPRGYDFDGGGADDHGKGMAHKLTAQFADPEKWLALGPSLDHVLATHINPGLEGARRPPLNLMVGRFSGERSLDYISYSEARTPVAAMNSPWTAYAELTGLTRGAAPTPEAEELVIRRRQSVIDLVSEQFADLRRMNLSLEDDRKLEQHKAASPIGCRLTLPVGTVRPISCA